MTQGPVVTTAVTKACSVRAWLMPEPNLSAQKTGDITASCKLQNFVHTHARKGRGAACPTAADYSWASTYEK